MVQVTSWRVKRASSPLAGMPLGVWALGLLAARLGLLRRGYAAAWRDELTVLAPAAVVFVSTAIGYGVPRLRDSFDVALPVLAAAGALAIGERFAQRRRAPRRFAAASRQPVV